MTSDFEESEEFRVDVRFAGGIGAGAVLDAADLLHGHLAVLEQQGEVPAVLPHGTERREPSARHARDTPVRTFDCKGNRGAMG